MHVEHHGLAGQLLGVVLLGEGDVDVHVRADLSAHQLILEAGDEGTGAQDQVVVLGGATLELLLAQEAGVVDVDLVVQLGGAVGDLDPAGGAVAGALDLGLHVVLGDLVNGLDDAQVLVRTQGHVGTHEHLDGELELLAAADLLDIQLGTVNHVHIVLGQGSLIDLGEDRVEGILIENALAVVGLDDLHRSLASAEAGNIDLLDHLLIGLLDALFKLLGLDGKVQLDLIGRQFFESAGHWNSPPALINSLTVSIFCSLAHVFPFCKKRV